MPVTDPDPTPFRISFQEDRLEDLRRRLENHRWSQELRNPDFARNFEPAYLEETLTYWREEFDPEDCQSTLNRFEHRRVTLNDQVLHYLHAAGSGPDPVPILLLHGWPSSFAEFLDLVPRLSDPNPDGEPPGSVPSFEVVVPSLPGYGFSTPLSRSDLGIVRMADLFHQLMVEVLGHERYGVFGGDWGAVVASRLGQAHPDSLTGIHLSMVGVPPHPDSRTDLSPGEKEWLGEMGDWRRNRAGYQSIQRTNPYPLGVALNDSPGGLCAWILDKFCAWSENPPGPAGNITRDEFLTNLMIYWHTQTIPSSIWLYRLHETDPWTLDPGESISVPTGFTLFPHDIPHPPREWAERMYDVKTWHETRQGGHFPALEETELLAGDLRDFFAERR